MKTETTIAGFALLGMPVFIILALAGIGIYQAWAFWILWNWFVPTTFLAVPALTIWQAWGLGLVKGSLFWRVPNKGEEKGLNEWGFALLTPLILLGVGFILQRFLI